MYIRTFDGFELRAVTGMGQPPDPTPKDQLFSTCSAWVVNLPFKHDFKEFRQEVLKAIGRHVDGRANKRQLSSLVEGTDLGSLLKSIHGSIQTQTSRLKEQKNNVPIKATLHSSNGKLLWLELVLLGGFSTPP